MTDHALLPAVCDACRDAMLTRAQPGTVGLHVLFCPHHRTLARVTVSDGVIRYWTLDAPVPADAAQDVLEKAETLPSASVAPLTH